MFTLQLPRNAIIMTLYGDFILGLINAIKCHMAPLRTDFIADWLCVKFNIRTLASLCTTLSVYCLRIIKVSFSIKIIW